MIDRFPELLQELATELDIDLYPDKRGACKLVTEDGLHVQMEVDVRQESLLIASFICEIPPGKFRENILRDALKSNGPFPKNGTLAYSERNNKLTLFLICGSPISQAVKSLNSWVSLSIRPINGAKPLIQGTPLISSP